MSGHHHHHAHGGDGHGAGKAVSVTLFVNLCVTAAKWFAFAVTRSPSLFGEAMHSTADSMNPLVLWLGHRRSSRPAHGRHPLGHGRESYFWSLIAAQLMLLVGASLTAWHGIETIVAGTVPRISGAAIAVMVCAAVGEAYSLLTVWRQMRKERKEGKSGGNPLLLALLVENGADVMGITLAFAGYGIYTLTGNALWDAAFSLAIAALLASTSLFLINRNRSLIVGEAAGPDVEAAVRSAIDARPKFATVVRLTATIRGPGEVECHLEMRWDPLWFIFRTDTKNPDNELPKAFLRARRQADALREEIKKRAPQVTRIIIEIT